MRCRTALWSVVAGVIVVCGFAGVAEAARADGLTKPLGETGTGMLIIGFGLFSIAGGVFAWPFFMNSRKAQFFVRLLGQNGARGFYVILGAVICFFGFMVISGKGKTQDASASVSRTR